MNSSAEVYLDGRLLTTHDGGYSTFRVNLTDGLADGSGTLVVIVDNAKNERVYPQQADFTFYGGIYREVRQITVGREHFDLAGNGGPGLIVTTNLDGDRAEVALSAAAVTTSGGSATDVRFAIDGEATVTVPLVDGEANATLSIEHVHRWHGAARPAPLHGPSRTPRRRRRCSTRSSCGSAAASSRSTRIAASC